MVLPGSNFNSPIVADLTRSNLLGALLSLYSTMYGIGTCSWIISNVYTVVGTVYVSQKNSSEYMYSGASE